MNLARGEQIHSKANLLLALGRTVYVLLLPLAESTTILPTSKLPVPWFHTSTRAATVSKILCVRDRDHHSVSLRHVTHLRHLDRADHTFLKFRPKDKGNAT